MIFSMSSADGSWRRSERRMILSILSWSGADDAHGCEVTEAEGEVFPAGVERVGHHGRLITGDAVQAPDEFGDALGVGGLEGTVRFDGHDDPARCRSQSSKSSNRG